MRVILTREECYCAVSDLYDNILKRTGKEPAPDDVYEPSRVYCSTNVMETVKQFIKDMVPESKEDPDTFKMAFALNWVNSGPQAVEWLNDQDKYIVEVKDLWVHKKEADAE